MGRGGAGLGGRADQEGRAAGARRGLGAGGRAAGDYRAARRPRRLRVFPPVPVDDWPADLARLQVSGTDLDDPRPPGSAGARDAGALAQPRIADDGGKGDGAGRARGAVGLVGTVATRRSAWLDRDFDLAVRAAGTGQWAELLASGLPVVTDGGFTEVAPGSATVVARPPGAARGARVSALTAWDGCVTGG